MSVPDDLQAQLGDRYTIDREIARGGMATVYLAHDLKHDRDVALKVMHPEVAVALGRERFLREIKLTAKLSPAASQAGSGTQLAQGQMGKNSPDSRS